MTANLQRLLRQALQAGDDTAAIGYLEQAVEQAVAAGDNAAAGRHLGNLALIYNRIQQPEAALACFERALRLVRAGGDAMTESGLLGNMGNIRRYDEAIAYLNEALHLSQTLEDIRGRGIWLANLALAYDDSGKPVQAIDYHIQAVAVARQLHDQRGLATRLGKLSDSFLAAGNPLEALQCLGEALTIYTAIGDQQAVFSGLVTSGHIHYTLGEQAPSSVEKQLYYRNAHEYYQYALGLAQTSDDSAAVETLQAWINAVRAAIDNPAERVE